MTVTPPPTGLRAHLRRLARVAVATLLATVLLAPAQAAGASADAEAGEVTTVLSPGAGGIIAPGETAFAQFTIRNDTADALDGLTVELDLNRTALPTSAALTAWLDEGRSTGVFSTISSQSPVSVSGASTLSMGLFASPGELAVSGPGVYPIRVRVTSENSMWPLVTPSRSVLIVAPDRPAIALIVPLTLTPTDGDMLTAEELADATGEGGVLSGQLEALSGSAAILAVDPAIPAAIRTLGSRAPASARSWLTALEAVPNERFALQFADADLTVQAQAGLAEPLAAGDLTAALDPADFTAEEGAEAELPSRGELIGIRNARTGIVWPRGGLSDDELATLVGYVSGPVTTILPRSAAPDAPGTVATIGGHRVLLYADQASQAVSQALTQTDAEQRAAALTAAVARLALTAPPSPVLLALDRDEHRSGEALLALMGILETRADAVHLDDLLTAAGDQATLVRAAETPRADAVPQLLTDERELREFATILADPAVLTVPERTRLLRLLAVGEPAEGFAVASAAHRERTRGLIDSVGIRPSSDVQILSATVDLPVWVRNDLPWPITVQLHARSDDLRLEVEALTIVESIARNTARVPVPVEARVGSGEVDVTLRLTSPTGVRIGDPQTTHVIVRAEWEGIGLIALGVLVALLITFGVIRTIRRKRRPDAAEPGAGT